MKFRQVLCVVLCIAMLLAASVIPAQAKACGCGEVVRIFMDGFGSTLYYNYGTPGQVEAGMARTDDLAFGIGRLFRGAGLSVWERSWDPLANGLGTLFMGIMGHLRMDLQGNSVEPITNRWRIDPRQDHRESPQYTFHYDFRIDPFEAAKQLNEFIEAVVKATGHSKIALTGSSEGAIVTMTYLKVYGLKRLETLILLNGAHNGLTLVGELFTNKFALSGPATANFIADMDDGSGSLKLAMRLLAISRALDFTAPLGRGIMNAMGERIYADTLIPLFGQMPILWAFVPTEYYPEARKLLSDPKYATLLAMADKYHKEVMSQADALLKNARAKGVKVALISHYGLHPIPVTRNSTYQCDGLIDTDFEASGSTSAPIGQTLPPSDSKYRSPDGVVDAATCVLPDQTWFIKGAAHESGPSRALRDWIIHSKKQPTVWDSEEWPQYLVKVEGKAVPQ